MSPGLKQKCATAATVSSRDDGVAGICSVCDTKRLDQNGGGQDRPKPLSMCTIGKEGKDRET